MGLREKKREATRQAILRAAARLFEAHEYDLVRVEEIAADAEVAKGTIYNYFLSKEEIAAALADAAFREGLSQVDALLAFGATPRDVLETLFIAGAGWAQQNPRLAQITLSHVLRQAFLDPNRSEQVEGYGALFALIQRMVELGQTKGQFRQDIAAAEVARTLAFLHAQTLWLWTAAPSEENPTERMKRSLTLCLDGIARV